MLEIKLQKLPNGLGLPLPRRMSQGSAGFDLHAALIAPLEIEPGSIALVPCGFAMAVPPGFVADVRPRSGLAVKFGITVINTPGTIDADYRGEVMVPLVNLGPERFMVQRGDRIAQMVVLAIPDVQLLEVRHLDSTDRGNGGLGHTGV